jgi:hypothetical protein
MSSIHCIVRFVWVCVGAFNPPWSLLSAYRDAILTSVYRYRGPYRKTLILSASAKVSALSYVLGRGARRTVRFTIGRDLPKMLPGEHRELPRPRIPRQEIEENNKLRRQTQTRSVAQCFMVVMKEEPERVSEPDRKAPTSADSNVLMYN